MVLSIINQVNSLWDYSYNSACDKFDQCVVDWANFIFDCIIEKICQFPYAIFGTWILSGLLGMIFILNAHEEIGIIHLNQVNSQFVYSYNSTSFSVCTT